MNKKLPIYLSLLILILLKLTYTPPATFAQSDQYPGFRVQGRYLYDRFGNKVILVGVNKMIIWTDRDGLPSFPEIAKTGANSVRLVWGTEGTAEELDIAIANAIEPKLTEIVLECIARMGA